MENIPFGIARLDRTLGGGSPPGSVVLLAGESGAGAREFLQTSVAMNVLADTDPDLFDLYYGSLPSDTRRPSGVHYVSLTASRPAIERELRFTMADEIVEAVVDDFVFRDLAPEYFQPSPIPREWYIGRTAEITDLGNSDSRDSVFGSIGGYLSEHADGTLVVLDSITDLIGAMGDEIEWNDVAMLMRGLTRAAHRWGGLILVLVNVDTLTEVQFGQLMDAASGTFVFSWEAGGSQRDRVMVVREFRGVLSRLEEEDIIQFETEIHEGGFDISGVRKIR